MGAGTETPARSTLRAPLSRQRVLAAALAQADEHGLDLLTMQRLASSLGVTPMSLYNHVKNKDDVLAGISALIWEEVAATAPPADDPASWLRSLGRAIRDVGRRHPHVLGAFVAGGVFPAAMLEVIADQFDRAGSAEPESILVKGIATVIAFALGWVAMEASGIGALPGLIQETERQRIRRVMRALPPDTPDRLVDTAVIVCGSDTELLFTTGLEAVINGCGYG
jgi:AcrR family transcriptional regulator